MTAVAGCLENKFFFFVLQKLFSLNNLLVDNSKEMKRKTVDITDQQNRFQQSQ